MDEGTAQATGLGEVRALEKLRYARGFLLSQFKNAYADTNVVTGKKVLQLGIPLF